MKLPSSFHEADPPHTNIYLQQVFPGYFPVRGMDAFFDRNDVFTQMQRRSELQEIEESKDYFAQKIAEGKKFSNDMRSNADAIEKFVREKYLMKRNNEDLFLIEKPVKE